MNIETLKIALNCISSEYNIDIENIYETLYKYCIIPKQLMSIYNKNCIYKNPATKLLADKYNVDTSSYSKNNKLKISFIKSSIKQHEEMQILKLEKKYLYLVFTKFLGISIACQLLSKSI
jgi:hypothetical protein